MVTHHTASLTTAKALGRSEAMTLASRSVASAIAMIDQASAFTPAAGSARCSRFQATRQPAEQNLARSRRGVDEAPPWAHVLEMAISRSDAQRRRLTALPLAAACQ